MKTRLLLPFLAVIVSTSALHAQIGLPETIAYQGYLTDGDGEPFEGPAKLTFSLWDNSTDGATVWQERQLDVPVSNGVFTVELGSVETLTDVPFDRHLWLAIAVDGGEDLSPRIPLSSVPFAFGVKGLRVLPPSSQITPSPSVVLGHLANEVAPDIDGATIGGGGLEGDPNSVAGAYGTVGGGVGNTAGSSSTVGGGSDNGASGSFSTIGGGSNNTSSGDRATVAGGIGNTAEEERSTVGGGSSNSAIGDRATIAGGENNTADRYATVGGGQVNNATGFSATIGGGTSNEATGEYATVGGGQGNEATGNHSVVGGGRDNIASGLLSMVPGGFQTHATGFTSFAAGYNARSLHDGSFVWTDTEGIPAPFTSTGEDQFLIRSAGGVGINTNSPRGPLHIVKEPLGADAGDFSSEALLVEGSEPLIGIYSLFQSETRPGLLFVSVNEQGNVVDKWGIVREYFGFNRLQFTYGLNDDHRENDAVMSLSSDGAEAQAFTASRDLGSSGTPPPGSHYRDNVVYAWAHVNGDGSVVSSFGCTVQKIIGFGRYQVAFKLQLPEGVSAVVTAKTLNDPVLASVTTTSTRADVATKVFNGSAFIFADYGFYIQVVGRP